MGRQRITTLQGNFYRDFAIQGPCMAIQGPVKLYRRDFSQDFCKYQKSIRRKVLFNNLTKPTKPKGETWKRKRCAKSLATTAILAGPWPEIWVSLQVLEIVFV